ncbi:MAG: efflux RND transporter periplasmic adaptor subunit [Lachnospiraceae bacterium]|nr:efflux RND transporter periplasmic adaptor subunit [Lachnospiraceae bacterium]
MKFSRKPYVFITSCFFSTAILFSGCSVKANEYITETAQYDSLANEVEVTGVVHGETEKTYYSEVSAPISMLTLKVGDTVKNGEKIVEYDTWDLENSLTGASLSVESSQSSADGQVKDSNKKAAIYNKATSDVEIYKLLYAWARTDSDAIDINQYKEAFDVKTVQRCMNASIADKQYQLTKLGNDISNEEDIEKVKKIREEMDDLEEQIAGINKDIANLPLAENNPEEYKRLIADSNWMADIRTNWTQSQTQANAYEGQILNSSQKDALYKNVEVAKLSEDIAAKNLETAITGICSEMNGIVTSVKAEPGAMVAKGSPIITIEDADNVKVDVEISKYDIGYINEGQRASINISGIDYDGTVSKINRFATGGTSDNAKVKVSVKINNPNDRVYLGIQADVIIFTEEKTNVLTIPRESYYSDDTGEYVYAIENGTVEKKYIKTGIVNDEKVEITGGISEGCVVITDAITDEEVGSKAVSK